MNQERNSSADRMHTNSGRGPQGVDKAPGEETATGTENTVAETQKGKNQVDGDPENSQDQPVDKQDIQ